MNNPHYDRQGISWYYLLVLNDQVHCHTFQHWLQQYRLIAVRISETESWGQKKKYVCLRSPDRPYFSAADPNLFYRQLFDPNFC